MKAIILARVSTSEQLEEGFSIPAQLERAREYAKRKGLEVDKEYCFDESSTHDQRKKFEQVIQHIQKSKDKLVLIVETVDRLQRSFKESVALDDYRKSGKLELHFIRENLIIHQNSNSSEIQRWDLAVFVAKSYVLQLSDNVRRSFEQMFKNGEWCSKAPFGYLNVVENGKHTVVPDPINKFYVKEMFSLYSTKNYSFKTLADEIYARGYKTKAGKAMGTSQLERIIKNPFYYGVMRVKGVEMPHIYEPLISKELFMKCQSVRQSWNKQPFKYANKQFVLRGLIKCADPACGCTISPETQDGKNYYACTNHRGIHEKRNYIREEALLEPIAEKFRQLQVPPEQVKEIVEEIKKECESKSLYHEQALATLKAEYTKAQGRIDGLMDLLLDQVITREDYEAKLNKLKGEQEALLAKMKEHTAADKEFYITAAKVFDVANRAYDLFQTSEMEEKREIIKFLVQNLFLKERELIIELKKPFCSLMNYSKMPPQNKRRIQSSDQIRPLWLPIHNNLITILQDTTYMTNLWNKFCLISNT